jgi:hypothetical protein
VSWEPRERGAEVGSPIAEVRAEPEINVNHGYSS